MKDLAGFPPQTIALIMAASAAYFVICWAPVIWPIIATHKQRGAFPRRWLFVGVVLSLAYGVIVAFLMLITLPITAYSVFVAPQLSANGFHFADPLLRANRFVTDFWWLLLPPALLLNTFWFVRKLRPIWPAVCQALTANNSFKPKPLRGSA
ncbi:hypothetical protein ACW5EG_16935 [Luteimonas sp. A611]